MGRYLVLGRGKSGEAAAAQSVGAAGASGVSEEYRRQLEEQFGIMMEPDDIVDLNSFEKGKEMLSSKYGVEF